MVWARAIASSGSAHVTLSDELVERLGLHRSSCFFLKQIKEVMKDKHSAPADPPFWFAPWQGRLRYDVAEVVGFFRWAAVLFAVYNRAALLPLHVDLERYDDRVCGVSLPADLF